jgi:SAM-dependent methyltransferase
MTCRVCSGTDLKFFYASGDKQQFRYYRCGNCGLVNLDMEGVDIFDNQKKYFNRFIPPVDYEREKGARDAYGFIKRFVPLKGRYLDIGCGSGGVLYFARKDGWEVKGLEISADYAKYLKERLGFEVETANFLEYENPREKFDLVSLRHVLEHLPDSVLAMNKISGLLVERGYAHLEFPNIDGLAFRMKRFMEKSGLYKKKWDPDFVPGHCNEFSRRTFEYLLGLTGFELVRWETYSFKPLKNFFHTRIHIGTKARAIIRKR